MIHMEKISTNQLTCLVILTQVGVSVLTIPYTSAHYSGFDSWISLLLGGLICQVAILIIYQLGKRYALQPLPQYITAIVGKPLGWFLNVLIAAYFAENSLMVVVSYADVISRWKLFMTPWFVLIGVSVVIAAYIASSTLRTIATITQTIMLMFAICCLIIFISGMGKGDLRHLLPVGSHGIGAIIRGTLPTFWSYSGFELLLYAFPFVSCRSKKEIAIAVSTANGVTTLFYVLISIIVLYNFSEKQMNSIPEPMVYILRKFSWPVVQSLDILFMAIWMSVTTVTVYVYLFMSARYLAFARRQEIRNHPLLVWILAFVCFAIGIWGSDRQWIFKFSDFHNSANAVMIFLVPTFLLLVSLVRGKAETG
ncbi:GerAB/ArcD/ProY family transporter [Paenibacillus cremeus]|uniref:GerAB/ArcD/ProY family transporter n=1 Tax=Paenibacillus cremeus TaxID=2163881 RepID=A0A559K9R2_9BACL|nr:GerAB/ArcD/ProY family transporter [Paenibacillus cremeus]TVY08870.1 GerAB/ArcD/ProY family transporter [Paenibacillus cremeus]